MDQGFLDVRDDCKCVEGGMENEAQHGKRKGSSDGCLHKVHEESRNGLDLHPLNDPSARLNQASAS